MAFMSSNISLSTPPTVMPFDLEQVIRDISLRNSDTGRIGRARRNRSRRARQHANMQSQQQPATQQHADIQAIQHTIHDSNDDDLAILNSIMMHSSDETESDSSDETESDSSDETESIDSIKHASLSDFSIFKVVNSSENCGICYEKSDVKTPCLHSFCTSCITKWVCDEEKRNCPYCRFNFP
jgi:hypothetical protein